MRVEAWIKRRSGNTCLFFCAVAILATVITGVAAVIIAAVVLGSLGLFLHGKAHNLQVEADSIHNGIRDSIQ